MMFSKHLHLFKRYLFNMPELVHEVSRPYNKATFGMGCFWANDSLFGATQGVLRTRVGYSGGQDANPTYKNIGDHTEVIEIHFEPEVISYNDLLRLFWNNHEYGLTASTKRQYRSLILYHDDEQKQASETSMKQEAKERNEKLVTEIAAAGAFYPAEDYHQKYRLQGHTWLAKEIDLNPKLLQTSFIAARLNGYLVGLGTKENVESDITKMGLTEKMADYLRTHWQTNLGGSLYC